jgi:2-oxoglutarate ferredoxin oxidoreductase subunit beta
MSPTAPVLDKKDFESDQQVRWCPGCGDYAILSSMLKVFAEMGVDREKIAVISGIGCAARFPYYVNTYGFHTIHGRAPAIATGLKVARPDLHVWAVGGDGDMLSIGGNHFLHALRRNVTIKILCFDNRIYGLTKGQTSPTSEYGKVTKTTPLGSLDRPVNPISLALASEATFVARTANTWNEHFRETMLAAAKHEGSAFVQILQNCVVFNDDSWEGVVGREEREEHALFLKHGQPLLFGHKRDKGLRLRGKEPEVVTLGEDGVTEKDLLVHDEKDGALAYLLSRLDTSRFPTPVGIFHREEGLMPLEKGVARQREEATKKKGKGDVMKLIHSGETWKVPG